MFPFFKSLEMKRDFSEQCLAKENQGFIKSLIYPQMIYCYASNMFPYETVGRKHTDKLLQDVTNKLFKREMVLCV